MAHDEHDELAGIHPSTQVSGVVSTFNPGPENVANVKWLLLFVEHVVVVDDGSPGEVSHALAEMEKAGALVVRLKNNSGIARALNVGIREATDRWNPEWILTMDQDSRLTGNYVSSALATARASQDPDSVGMVCAESHNHSPLPTWGGRKEPQIFDPMTSGSLVRTSTFAQIGSFDEGFFIDCVDSEFNARLREHGLRALAGRGCNWNTALAVRARCGFSAGTRGLDQKTYTSTTIHRSGSTTSPGTPWFSPVDTR